MRVFLLEEVYDVVDHIFIIEATQTHALKLRKPLSWERVKMQPRFQRFADKVLVCVLYLCMCGVKLVRSASWAAPLLLEALGIPICCLWPPIHIRRERSSSDGKRVAAERLSTC